MKNITAIVYESHVCYVSTEAYFKLLSEPNHLTLNAMSNNPHIVNQLDGTYADIINNQFEVPLLYRRFLQGVVLYES